MNTFITKPANYISVNFHQVKFAQQFMRVEEVMQNYAIRIILAAPLLLSLASCKDEPDRKGFNLQTQDKSLYLVNRDTGATYTLKSGEFIRIPIIETQPKVFGLVKNLAGEVPDLTINVSAKYLDSRIAYKITVEPQLTKEFSEYIDEILSRVTKKKDSDLDKDSKTTEPAAPLVKPDQMYKNPNWEKYFDVPGNSLGIHFRDADSFSIKNINLTLAGTYMTPRTRQLGYDDKVSSILYEGEIPLTASEFTTIESIDITYVLEKK